MIKILAIPGSLRAQSSSNQILRTISTIVPKDISFVIYDGVGGLPHFNDSNETPATVADFRKQLQEADGVLICQPEYAFGVAGSLKNALDWTVSSGEFADKPVSLVTTATGGDKAHAAMMLTLKAMSSKIIGGATLLIPFVKAKLDANGNLHDITIRHQLQSVIEIFIQTIHDNR